MHTHTHIYICDKSLHKKLYITTNIIISKNYMVSIFHYSLECLIFSAGYIIFHFCFDLTLLYTGSNHWTISNSHHHKCPLNSHLLSHMTNAHLLSGNLV